jgi:serine phosphatase RsbU (regulator of sigma subunit)
LLKRKLKFNDAELEKEFINDYYDKSLMTVRIALIIGIILYSLFAILDILLAPLSKTGILFIRFAIVSPGLLIVFILTFFKFFRKYMQPILMFITLIAGLGIVAMVGITIETEIVLYYYAGLMLVMMWAYTFIKLRFIHATVVCWTIVLSYEITTIYFQDMFSDKKLFNIFINNNFFFISSNIIGMFAGYLIELYTRKDFLYRREIAKKQKELKKEHNELQYRIKLMDDELEIACQVQQKLIPSDFPVENIFAYYKPMKVIGGDFMDFIKFNDDNKIGIFICDVSGHGVPAALVTSIIKSSIHESKQYYSDPSLLLMHLNDVLKTLTEDLFVTAFYCIYDAEKRSLIYSNAGHHSPAVILPDKVDNLNQSRSLPLGIMGNNELANGDFNYTNSSISLSVNSKILFYTDGFVESKKSDNPKIGFGYNLKERLMVLHNLQCREFIETLFDELVQFHGSAMFDDDICIICLDVL